MESYGVTVRKLRQDKGFLQKEIYEGVVAKSFAIRFEKGEVMLQYDTFLTVLEALNVSQEEFHFIHRGYQGKKEKTIWIEFAKAANANNKRQLEEIYQQYRASKVVFERVVAYLANILLVYQAYSADDYQNHLNHQEVLYLQDYLLKKESWTLDEMNIFTSCYFIFDQKIKQLLMKSCYNSLRKYQEYPNYIERMTNLLSNYIIHCYDIGEYQEANKWFVKVQSLPRRKEFLYYGLSIDLCSAYYYYVKRDYSSSKDKIDRYVAVLVNSGFNSEAEQSLKHFNEFKVNFDRFGR
ncbi:hypothetical protein I6N95_11955 [Vagococcus sp. BWB3-3]|uniref:HTH cro/C1-type domain-containing protein n=1 Tax=Vagococcus allomyrinae TaxID=2794353 RepID=A0A940PF70_9ENTE|nr:Rgg/GadR/MutR family transcriptional regulator [Vagococcus allomyrinae]MBP1041723.1 hypothetical protein [Vagococcus allomyrinae]